MEIRTEQENFRLSELPDKVTLYTDKNGSATLRVPFLEGSYIFLRSSGDERDSTACYSIEEAVEIFNALGLKIQEAKSLRDKYGPVPEQSDLHQWLGSCPVCHKCHTDVGEVTKLNDAVMASS